VLVPVRAIQASTLLDSQITRLRGAVATRAILLARLAWRGAKHLLRNPAWNIASILAFDRTRLD
jgi:hypothetical protein